MEFQNQWSQKKQFHEIKSIKPQSTQKIASVILEMVNLSQREPTKKSLISYYQKFQRLANQASDTDLSKKAKVALFIQGLQSSSTIWGMYEEAKDTLDTIFQKTQRIMDSQDTIDIRYNSLINRLSSHRYRHVSSSSSPSSSESSVGCGYCKKMGKQNWQGHSEKKCFAKKRKENPENQNSKRDKINSILNQLQDMMNEADEKSGTEEYDASVAYQFEEEEESEE